MINPSLLQELYQALQIAPNIRIDHRLVQQGDLFWALGQTDEQGQHRGNAFAPQALAQGASLAIVNNPELAQTDPRYRYVPDGLQALQTLARYHRSQWQTPVIAIVGSNGKTTTRRLVESLLSTKLKVFATKGNLNNHIGLPLCLLQYRGDCDVLVLELGANHLGETQFLAELAQPDFGLITNCGKDHLGEYGSEQAIIQANTELYQVLAQNHKPAWVNAQDPILVQAAQILKQKYFYQPSELHINHSQPLQLQWTDPQTQTQIQITTPFFGGFWRENIAHALAIARHFGISDQLSSQALQTHQPEALRSETRHWLHHQVILDCYNANPSSMQLFIQEAKQIPNPHKILVLGEMLELGPYEHSEHQNILDNLADFQGQIHLFGPIWQTVAWSNYPHIQYFKDKKHLAQTLAQYPQSHQILFKGSRGNRLEQILDLV